MTTLLLCVLAFLAGGVILPPFCRGFARGRAKRKEERERAELIEAYVRTKVAQVQAMREAQSVAVDVPPGFAPMPHETDSPGCWCRPELRCAECNETAPCTHGTQRATIVVHKAAS